MERFPVDYFTEGKKVDSVLYIVILRFINKEKP